MLRKYSVMFYNHVYSKGMYDEPMGAFLPVVREFLIDKAAPKKILDAACGYNNQYLSSLLRTKEINAENLVGTDVDENVIGANKIHHDIRVQDLHNPIGVNEFDAVISLYTWEHLHDSLKVMKNFHSALRKNGKLIIIAPQRYCYISITERLLPVPMKNLAWRLLKGKKVMPYPAYFNLCTKNSLKKAAHEVGFEMKHFQALDSAPTWFANIPPLFMLMCLVMTMFNKFSIFENFRGAFVTVLEKR